MKRIITLFSSVFFMISALQGQQSLFGGQEIISPEINEDNTVTFRLLASNAKEVKLLGDWLPPKGWTPGEEILEKNDEGIWEHTTKVLSSDLYTYTFMVDGVKTIDPNNAFVQRDIANLSNIFIVEGQLGDYYKVRDIQHGSVTRCWYNSPGLQMDRRLTVYTPPGYEQSKEKFPVLYLLHGAGGDEEAWISLGRAAQIFDNLISERKIVPMIVVMPNGNVIQDAAPGEGKDGFYKPQFMIPGTMDGTYEASFPDIINFVEKNFRVKRNKQNRAIAGLSMGGFHSLHISRYHQNMFDYVGLFSAAILPNENVTSNTYNNINETLKNQKENGLELYWIGIGKTDFLYQGNKEYCKKLDEMDFKYTYRESEGGHIWKNWRMYLTEFTPLLFQ